MANRNSTPARVAIYARVSTLDQSTDSQLLDLRRYTQERGWHLHREYCDNGVSGLFRGSEPEGNRPRNANLTDNCL